jgi:hypothetical protein
MNKIIKKIFVALSVLLFLLINASAFSISDAKTKELISSEYGTIGNILGIGDSTYKVVYDSDTTGIITKSSSLFKPASVIASTITVIVSVKPAGSGVVKVYDYSTMTLLGTVTSTGSFTFSSTGSIGIVPIANPGYTLEGLCDYTGCLSGVYWGPVDQISIWQVTANFKSNSVTPTPQPGGIWSVDVTEVNDAVQIGACVGSSGGYYKLKSTTNTVLRSNYLESNACRSSSESKSYLYSLEHGNWIAYVTDQSGVTKTFKSFSVNPTIPITPQPTSTYIPIPTSTAQPGSYKVNLQSNPSNAQAFVNNVFIGNTPVDIGFTSGETKTITYIKSGYTTKSFPVSYNEVQHSETLSLSGTPQGTATPTGQPTTQPTIRTTPPPCPTGLIWDATNNKCVAPPETSDDTYIYAGIILLLIGGGVYITKFRKPKK